MTATSRHTEIPVVHAHAEQRTIGVVRLYLGMSGAGSTEPIWRWRDIPIAELIDPSQREALIKALCLQIWPDPIGSALAPRALDVIAGVVRSAVDQEDEVTAIAAVLPSMIGVTEVFERFALYGIGFVGALAGYLVTTGNALTDPAGIRGLTVGLLAMSLVAGGYSAMIGIWMAQGRVGILAAETLQRRLADGSIPPSRFMHILQAALRWQARHLRPWDRQFIAAHVAHDQITPSHSALRVAASRMNSAAQRQATWMRVQLILAVMAALSLAGGILYP